MTDTVFPFCDTSLTARPSGVLWWEEAGLLCVADLHLGRSERLARRGGGLLPPYETADTLQRLAAEIDALQPRSVICLGDSFDDSEAALRLDPAYRRMISGMMAGRRWIWIAGNHDPDVSGLGGTVMEDVARGPLTFRHIAQPRGEAGEVSGHYHPKMKIATRAGQQSRPCFAYDSRRLILPAFGSYTGGLNCTDAALATLFDEDAICILTGSVTASVPMRQRASA